MATYRTRQGDVLDLVCVRHYGLRRGLIEVVYEANPGLCEQPVVLPAGLVIVLPDLPREALPRPQQKLWD